jgi:hypothetical protein
MSNRPTWYKHVLDLRRADLVEHPIWVCAYNSDIDEPWFVEDPADEATFMPWSGILPYDCFSFADRSVLVAASFALADGTTLAGYSEIPRPTWGREGFEFRRTRPCVLLDDGPLGFWVGSATDEAIQRLKKSRYHRLGRDASAVFPVHYRIDSALIGINFAEDIPGFGRYIPQTNEIAVVK